MLVLQRSENTKIHIGRDIVVTVTRIGPGRVWLGIDAPKDRVILRDELLGRIKGDPFAPRDGRQDNGEATP